MNPVYKAPRKFYLRRILILLVMLFLSSILLASCKKNNDNDEVNAEPSESLSPSPSPSPKPTPQRTYAPDPTPSPEPSAEVTQVTARYFPDIEGYPTLYAAIEFKNTGNIPITVKDVTVKFNTGAFRVDGEFTPMLASDDVVYAGQTSTLVLWQTYEKEKDTLTADSEIKCSAEVNIKAYDSSSSDKRLFVSNLRLLKNYPNFCTISGNIRNSLEETDYALSLIYVSFYDEEDNLLGVWHFTRNLSIPADSTRNFVMHLQSLPIPDLDKQTARITARGIGIE